MLEGEPELAEVVQVELRQGQKFFAGPRARRSPRTSPDRLGPGGGRGPGAIQSDLPVKVATKMLFGAMDQMATSWVLGKRGYRLVATAPTVADLFLQGVAARR